MCSLQQKFAQQETEHFFTLCWSNNNLSENELEAYFCEKKYNHIKKNPLASYANCKQECFKCNNCWNSKFCYFYQDSTICNLVLFECHNEMKCEVCATFKFKTYTPLLLVGAFYKKVDTITATFPPFLTRITNVHFLNQNFPKSF